MKKSNIILSGVGGQGILTIAAAISLASLKEGLNTKQAEVHGMSQRGGAVQSHLRISDMKISSDLIPQGEADLILSVEPLEGLRYLPYLKKNGVLVTNSKPFINVTNYPDPEDIYRQIGLLPTSIILDADKLARDLASPRSSNIIMLGAASFFMCLDFKSLEAGVSQIFERKGSEIVDINLQALNIGREIASDKI